MSEYQLEIKQIVDYPRCRIYRHFIQNLMANRSIRTGGGSGLARQESGARKLEGHDIMALERFDPEVTHMIMFDVLSRESPIGDKGERMRLFLTESGYQKALESQNKAFIQILNHAGIIQGHLRYDRTDKDL